MTIDYFVLWIKLRNKRWISFIIRYDYVWFLYYVSLILDCLKFHYNTKNNEIELLSILFENHANKIN